MRRGKLKRLLRKVRRKRIDPETATLILAQNLAYKYMNINDKRYLNGGGRKTMTIDYTPHGYHCPFCYSSKFIAEFEGYRCITLRCKKCKTKIWDYKKNIKPTIGVLMAFIAETYFDKIN